MNSGFQKHGSLFTFCLALSLALLITAPAACGQTPPAQVGVPSAEAPLVEPSPSVDLPRAPSAHRFWDRKNVYLFSGIAATRALDYTSTRNMLSRGREEILLPDDVVNNRAGFVALEAAGAATSVGLSYLLHRTGHHRLERWLSIGHISVAGFGAARNYALESKHP